MTAPVKKQDLAERDSSGIRIVENAPRASTPYRFAIALTPTFRVGGAEVDANLEFDHRQGFLRAIRLSDGRIAVTDVVRIHFFNAEGSRERVVGRAGSGPEEFRSLSAICHTRGDTIVVADEMNRRLAVLDRNGAFVRTVPLVEYSVQGSDFCFDDGSVLVSSRAPAATLRDRSMRLTRLRLDGSVLNVVGTVEIASPDPLAFSQVSVLARGKRVYLGSGEKSEVRVLAADGAPVLMVRSADARVAMAAGVLEDRIRPVTPGSARQPASKSGMPRYWPSYEKLSVDQEGRLWIKDVQKDRTAREQTWTAFDSTGHILGRLSIPTSADALRFEVLGFGGAHVLVRVFGSDGAAYVHVYPLEERRP
jgi:hypothetical protein